MGSLGRRLKQKISRPLKRLEMKIKMAAQRFVIKTVSKHSSEIGQGSQGSQVMGWDSSHVDSLLLAFMRSSQRKEMRSGYAPARTMPFAATPFGDGRILAWHPHADFIFCDTADQRNSCLIAIGRFESSLTTQLEMIVGTGDCVYLIGDPIGFHALTAAKLAGETGMVVCLDEDATGLRSQNLSSNLVTNARDYTSCEELHELPSPNVILARIDDSRGGALLSSIPKQIEELAELHPQAQIVLQLSSGQDVEHKQRFAFQDCVSRLARFGRLPVQPAAGPNVQTSDTAGDRMCDVQATLMFESKGSIVTRSRAA